MGAKLAACSKMVVGTAVKMVAKVGLKKIGCDLGYEDGFELGCMQTWHVIWLQIRTEEEGATHADAEGTAKCTSAHTTQTNTDKSSHK